MSAGASLDGWVKQIIAARSLICGATCCLMWPEAPDAYDDLLSSLLQQRLTDAFPIILMLTHDSTCSLQLLSHTKYCTKYDTDSRKLDHLMFFVLHREMMPMHLLRPPVQTGIARTESASATAIAGRRLRRTAEERKAHRMAKNRASAAASRWAAHSYCLNVGHR